MGIGISLSGGGLRATLFHLGVICWLRDARHLRNITHICGVSGGSILAAHLALHWQEYISDDDESFIRATRQVLNLARRDVRGRILRRHLVHRLLLLNRFFPGRNSTTSLLEKEFNRFLNQATLKDLPETPNCYLLTTNLTTTALCAFSKAGFQVYESPEVEPKIIPTPHVKLGTAVTASTAFPALFQPYRLKLHELVTGGSKSEHYLTDGGLFDNVGAPWLHMLYTQRKITRGIISDATAPVEPRTELTFSTVLQRASRAIDIFMKRIADLEYSRLEIYEEHSTQVDRNPALNAFSVVKLSERTPRTVDRAAFPEPVHSLLRQVRTDLDRFNEVELYALWKHGYNAAQHVVGGKAHKKTMFHNWERLEDWFERYPKKVERSLKSSSRRRLRLFSASDPYSWAIGIALIVFLITTTFGYQWWKASVVSAPLEAAFPHRYAVFVSYSPDIRAWINTYGEADKIILKRVLGKIERDEWISNVNSDEDRLAVQLRMMQGISGATGCGLASLEIGRSEFVREQLSIREQPAKGILMFKFPGQSSTTFIDLNLRPGPDGVTVDLSQRAGDRRARINFEIILDTTRSEELSGPLLFYTNGNREGFRIGKFVMRRFTASWQNFVMFFACGMDSLKTTARSLMTGY